MDKFLSSVFGTLSVTESILFLILLLISIYNRIKYLCLEKACEKIVKAESYTELSGEEKFELVTKWIQESLPIVFTISIFRTLIESLVQYAYDNSFKYMSNYIKRKTGLDLTKVIEEVKNNSNTASDES